MSANEAKAVGQAFIDRIEKEDELKAATVDVDEEDGEPLTEKPLKFSLAYGESVVCHLVSARHTEINLLLGLFFFVPCWNKEFQKLIAHLADLAQCRCQDPAQQRRAQPEAWQALRAVRAQWLRKVHPDALHRQRPGQGVPPSRRAAHRVCRARHRCGGDPAERAGVHHGRLPAAEYALHRTSFTKSSCFECLLLPCPIPYIWSP